MRIQHILLVVFLAILINPPLEADVLEIAADGQSAYKIVLSAGASGSAKHGAKELSHFLRKITGAEIPIVTDDDNYNGPMILVGRSRKLDALGLRIPWKDLGNEGYVIRTEGKHLILAGSRARGAMYACYGFLEDHLGCHWLIPGIEVIPRRAQLQIERINETVIPAFEYRHVYHIVMRDPLWAVRNRMNDVKGIIPPAMGGQVSFSPFVHSYFIFVPPKKYFKSHPEYFSEIDGKRIGTHAQLCLSNPEVVEIVAREVREVFRQRPDVKIASVSQMDWGNWCRCKKCRTLDENEGTPAASIINFANKVAEKIEKEFPDRAIDTLAYQYSLKAPRTIRPRPNVIVRIAITYCANLHPGGNLCETQKIFLQTMRDWKRLTNRIYVWNYQVNFDQLWVPHPSFAVIDRDVLLCRDNHVKGIFAESGGSTMPRLANLGHVRAYVLAKHLWNPKYGVDRALNEFLTGYYGDGGKHIRSYVDLIHKALSASGIHLYIYGNLNAPFISDEQLLKAQTFFDAAEQSVAKDSELLTRVRTERMALDWLTMYRSLLPYKVANNRLVRGIDTSQEFQDSHKRFFSHLKNLGPERLGPKPYKSGMELQSSVLNPTGGYNALTLANSRITLHVVPELGGRIWSIIDRKTGRDIALKMPPQHARALTMAGYTELMQHPGAGVGRSVAFSVISREDTNKAVSVKLTAQMTSGLKMERTITVPNNNSAEFTVRSILTNQGANPVLSAFRTFPELVLSREGPLEAYLKNRDGNWVRHEIKKKRTYFSGDTLPAGAWAIYAPSSKVGLQVNFHPEQVARTLLYSRRAINCRIECHSLERTLKPGESLTIEATYKIIHTPPK